MALPVKKLRQFLAILFLSLTFPVLFIAGIIVGAVLGGASVVSGITKALTED